MTVPPLTWLYVPADRPDRVEKAIASRAHAVIVDLEDAVAPGAKAAARAGLAALLGEPRDKPVYVRVNAGSAEDLEAVAALALSGILVPKVARPEDVPVTERPVHCLIESAAGLEAAYAIASTAGVAGISLGESDLRSETGALEAGLDWARGRIVNAAVAAGLPRPPQSVYPHVRDAEGLARSCARGRELGHLGRTAIHPDQLPVIEQAYLPTDDRGRARPRNGRAAGGGSSRDARRRRVRRRGDAGRGAADRGAGRVVRNGLAGRGRHRLEVRPPGAEGGDERSCLGPAARDPGLDDDEVGTKRGGRGHGLRLPRVPRRVARDHDEAASVVLGQHRGQIAGRPSKLDRDGVGEDVGRAVLGFARQRCSLRG